MFFRKDGRAWKTAGLALFVLILAASLILGGAGCKLGQTGKRGGGGGGGGSSGGGGKTTVGVAIASGQTNAMKEFKTALQSEAKKQKNLTVLWRDAAGDPARQAKNIEDLLKKKAKVIVFEPVDPRRASTLVNSMKQKKVKVLALSTAPQGAPADGLITPDYRAAGRLAAEAGLSKLAQQRAGGGGGGTTGGIAPPAAGAEGTAAGMDTALPGPARVLVLAGDPKDPVATTLTSGYLDVLRRHPDVSVNVVRAPKWDKKVATSALTRAATSTDVVLANDSSLLLTGLQQLQKTGAADKVVTVGAGADKQTADVIRSGVHDAEVDLRPDLLARYTLKAATDLATRGTFDYDSQVRAGDSFVPAKVIPVRLITKENVAVLEERLGKGTTASSGSQKGGKKPTAKPASQKKKKESKGGSSGGSSGGGSSGGSGGSSGGGGGSSGGGGQSSGQGATQVEVTLTNGRTLTMDAKEEIQQVGMSGSRLEVRTKSGKNMSWQIPGEVANVKWKKPSGGKSGGGTSGGSGGGS